VALCFDGWKPATHGCLLRGGVPGANLPRSLANRWLLALLFVQTKELGVCCRGGALTLGGAIASRSGSSLPQRSRYLVLEL